MRRLFVLLLALAIAGSTSWIVGPLADRALRSAEALVAGAASGLGPADADAALAAANDAVPDGPAAGPAGGSDSAPATPGAPTSADPGSILLPPAEGYVWPLVGAKITTYFAPAESGSMILDGQPVHNGLDLALPCWTPIRAAHAGTVLYAGRRADPYLGFHESVQPYYDELVRRKLTDRALPIMVVIDDGNGLISVYVHLAKATVRQDGIVAAGETIGFEGATGNATGCHLHYSIYLTDGPWVPVAPTLVTKWHYPSRMRLRIDPLLVLPLDSPDAARPRAGLSPPLDPPHYVAPPPYIPPLAWE